MNPATHSADVAPLRNLPQVLAQLESVLLGKRPQLEMAIACLLARGHLLIEGVPGVGKTTLAQALGATLGLDWTRVQFTSDLLPADVVGVSIFDATTTEFTFKPGPVFSLRRRDQPGSAKDPGRVARGDGRAPGVC